MRTAKEKLERRRRKRRREDIIESFAMGMPTMALWLGIVYIFVIELSK